MLKQRARPRVSRPTIKDTNSRGSRTVSTTTPAPVGGLDNINDLVSMDVKSAITLDNFIVKPYGCESRKGCTKWATNLPSYVNSLLPYQPSISANAKLFAASGNDIYDITSSTTAPSVVTGMSSDKWESTNVSIPGGKYLVAVNGVDLPRLYDGTTWSAFSVVASPAAPGEISTASSINPALWNNIVQHKLRLWAVEKDSTKAWYLPVNQLGGTAAKFDFGNYMSRGGYLVALATWTLDAGLGLDDLFVAITSEGEILVYQGSDPSSSTDWQLKGIYKVGAPLGKRCVIKYAGDLLYLSKDGLVPLSKYLLSDGLNYKSSLTNNINQQIAELSNSYSEEFGWEVIHYMPENVIMINVPALTGTVQYVFNTITNGWSRFTGWDAKTFTIFNGNLYFGSSTLVAKAFVSYFDFSEDNGLSGTVYQAVGQQAFNSFEKLGQKKQFLLCKVISSSLSLPTFATGITTDYNLNIQPLLSTTQLTDTLAVFDNSFWDGSDFVIPKSVTDSWIKVEGFGISASITVVFDVKDAVAWAATDWVYELGGVL